MLFAARRGAVAAPALFWLPLLLLPAVSAPCRTRNQGFNSHTSPSGGHSIISQASTQAAGLGSRGSMPAAGQTAHLKGISRIKKAGYGLLSLHKSNRGGSRRRNPWASDLYILDNPESVQNVLYLGGKTRVEKKGWRNAVARRWGSDSSSVTDSMTRKRGLRLGG